MKWGNQTHWDGEEPLDKWLERESAAKEKVEAPTCPHCGHIHSEWWEFSGLDDYEVEDYEIHCHSCCEKFLVNKETQIRFESRKVTDDQNQER